MPSKQPTFYQADAAVRTMGNRALVVAGISAVCSVLAVGGFLFTYMRPPTVIRILPNGKATVISGSSRLASNAIPSVLRNVEDSEAPTADEKENYVRTFVSDYMNYDAHTLTSNWATALNMMTDNLKSAALAQFRKSNTVGELEQDSVRSALTITAVQQDSTDPFMYHVYGVRTVNKTVHNNAQETRLVEAYQVKLTTTKRTVDDPSGLLVADFSIQQISSDNQPARFKASVANLTGDEQ